MPQWTPAAHILASACTSRSPSWPLARTDSSALDPAHLQAGGHATAEGVIDRDRRQRVADRRGHHVVPWRLIAAEELRERHGHGHAGLRRQEQELVQILVP